ncbi:site-2 protease family protein [Spirulina sp. CS-785/01]|uniref:site-2 protease family protein n=1 Tax=Spirulina sp. CS-785/01 TaxID=3021716 RepID=UPI00232DAC20|nr:site-2 protease family protein [Spirulina sp. CS-785/01]MDB9313648.1 site-2 protease family protein [Spirulina sp. CS-785/01]
MDGNIRVGTLFGIPFYINPSWFLILALGTFWFGEQFTQVFSGNALPWIMGLTTALLLFASVLAHELGHSVAALSQGIGVRSITLFIFGGLAMLEKESETPFQSFLVAIAGPLVSILLFALFTIMGATLPLPAPVAIIVSILATLNLILAVFNLIPGLPLDGGNVLKAAIWKLTGNPNKGLLYASRVGQIFGWVAITTGGLAVFGVIEYGSLWTVLIGFFLLQNAGMSAQSAQVQDQLDHYTARDAVIPESPIVSKDLTLREFVNEYVIGNNKWRKFLVTDANGQLVGAIATEDLKSVATSEWTERTVESLMNPIDNGEQILADESLLEVVRRFEQDNNKQLTVVDQNGVVLGLLEKNSIIKLLSDQQEGQPQDQKPEVEPV